MDFLQTTLCYLEKDGCYLMLHRVKKKNDANHDKWVGVGGKFEPGEDALACVMREVTEETGLTMQAPAYRGIVDFYCTPWPAERMHLYTCTQFAGTMTDCSEGTLEWVPKQAVQALPIWSCIMRGIRWPKRCWMGKNWHYCKSVTTTEPTLTTKVSPIKAQQPSAGKVGMASTAAWSSLVR